jgi:hypothetical protein
MRRVAFLAALFCLASMVQAQSPGGPASPPASPQETVLGARGMQELNANIQCQTARVGKERQYEDLKAAANRLQQRVSELEAKYEPSAPGHGGGSDPK